MDDEDIPHGFKKIDDDSEEQLVFLTINEMRAIIHTTQSPEEVHPQVGYMVWKAFLKFKEAGA